MRSIPRLVPGSARYPEGAAQIRAEVRAFLAHELELGSFVPAVDGWLSRWDESFTLRLAGRGWLGMTIPVEYGGHGRSFLERFIVTEELLAAGAPIAAHWIADRQIVPTLLAHGTELQKQRFLPRIAQGKCFMALGMSESESGSDLASVRSRASRVEAGWILQGSKMWTSGAHLAHAMVVLARNAPADPSRRREGLSQYIVELNQPGVHVSAIRSMNGEHHFNEVWLDDVFVPDEMVLGEIGAGWQQVTSELSFERSGPERFLSSFPLLNEMLHETRFGRLDSDVELGRLVARVAGLHHMSAAVAGSLERGEDADVAAAVVKVLGTTTEGDVAELASLCTGGEEVHGESYLELLASALDQRPGFTLRGGTNEVLQGLIARKLGLR